MTLEDPAWSSKDVRTTHRIPARARSTSSDQRRTRRGDAVSPRAANRPERPARHVSGGGDEDGAAGLRRHYTDARSCPRRPRDLARLSLARYPISGAPAEEAARVHFNGERYAGRVSRREAALFA